MSYDTNSNLISKTECSGAPSNQPVKIIYPTFEKKMTYDSKGRKTIEKDISPTETSITTYKYDAKGNLILKTDKESKATQYTYDALNRLIQVTDSDEQKTIYTYDTQDNLITLKDANGNLTLFTYDKNNRLIKETRPMGQETAYTYNASGSLIQKQNPKGQKIIYTYDKASRLTTIEYYSPLSAAPEKIVTFAYNNLDQLISYNDNTTSGTYTYDIKGRKIKETINYGLFTLTNTTTYYANNIKKTHTGPDNITHTYTYDPANNPSEINIPGIGNITYTTYNWTRPSEITLPGGSTKNMTYDPFMRIKNITAKDPGQNTILNYQYAYDKMDNIINKTTEHGDYHYIYDDLYRLISSDNPESQIITDENFAYDPAGNRITSNTTDIYSYTGNNELNAYDDTTCEYDANGNLIKKIVGSIVTGYVYNIEDRLTEVWSGEPETGTLTARYYYDPFGRRLWKEVSGIKTYYHYSDEGLTGEYDADGNEIKTYGYKPNSTWTTDPLFMKVGTEYYFYHNDHLGTPQKMTGVNGAVVWAARYESFGRAVIEVDAVENNLRFAGQYFDGESGLCYNYWRYYDPGVGRYIRVDPIGFAGGMNLFVYVGGNPVNAVDPLGFRQLTIIDMFCPIVTPFQIHGFKELVKLYFKIEYRKVKGLCSEKFIKDLEKCYNNPKTVCSTENDGTLTCEEQAEFDLITCNSRAYYWYLLSDNYSFLKALFESYQFDLDQVLDSYRSKFDNFSNNRTEY